MYFRVNFLLLSVILAVLCQGYASTFEVHEEPQVLRAKRDHGGGVTGPVHTFVKTDKHANFKWGVRHHVGHHYSG